MADYINPFILNNSLIKAKCCEISVEHLSSEAIAFFNSWQETEYKAYELLFDFFKMQHPLEWGIRLHVIPWSEKNLGVEESITVDQLLERHAKYNVPRSLSELLIKASKANIRVLIFDSEAPSVPGLAICC